MSSSAPRWKTSRCELLQDQTKGEPYTLKNVSTVRGKGDGCPSSEGNRSLSHTILQLLRERGKKRLPLERVYRLLYNPDLFLMAYGRIYRNAGAMTKGTTEETADGMAQDKIAKIIEDLRHERYRWSPARRVYIPKKNGTKRPLGVQSWSDKVVQEVIRLLLDAYLEPQFSPNSHGFRPERGCHTALREIYHHWKGSVWFIEGDISKCFDALSHELLLSILRETIKDQRFLRLISGLLKAGYLEDWRWNQTYSGTPQGSIVSPILANLYLDKLDKFVENVLIPQYTKGTKRKANKAYENLMHRASYLTRTGRKEEARVVRKQAQRLPSIDPCDPDYRRLRYCRYADDVRHLTHNEILLAEKGGTEEYGLRVISPTWNRKAKGKGACEKRGKRVKALMRCPARPA